MELIWLEGGGSLKILLTILTIILVQSLYKPKDTGLIRPGGAEIPLTIITIIFGTHLL